MKASTLVLGTILAGGLLLSGCGQTDEQKAPAANDSKAAAETVVTSGEQKETGNTQGTATEVSEEAAHGDFTGAVKELVDGLKKGAEAGKVDWAQTNKLYSEQIQSVVKALDEENDSQTDEQLVAAAKAGEEGSLSADVVAQLYDKLLQKTAFFSLRHDFKEANGKFTYKEFVKGELEEAREVYDGILKGMVEKRDKAYGTQLIEAVSGGFDQMQQAADKGDNLAYNLGKQVVDKSLMKAFYLASGAEKGYAYKVEQAAKENGDEAKVEQAEGWAFYQSLKKYLEKNDQASSDYINSQFDLSNDVKNVKGDLINKAFIRAFAATAKGEYGETFENWGKDKAVITALEGALFIDVIRADLPKALGGEDKAKSLTENSQKLLEEVKAGNKEKSEALFKAVEADLNKLAAYGK